MDEDNKNIMIWGTIGVVIIGGLILFALIGYPLLKPWWAEQDGKAELAQAEQNRQIAVLEAQAKYDSASLIAKAEIERAKGVAQANEIIGESLKDNEAYLEYLYINGLVENQQISKEIIYIPTEAGLPILEAGRRTE